MNHSDIIKTLQNHIRSTGYITSAGLLYKASTLGANVLDAYSEEVHRILYETGTALDIHIVEYSIPGSPGSRAYLYYFNPSQEKQ
jgi:hypothetical protein